MPLSAEARHWRYPLVAAAAAAVLGDAVAIPAGDADLVLPIAGVTFLLGVAMLARPGAWRWTGLGAFVFALCLARADAVYRPWIAVDDVAALELPQRRNIEGVVERMPERRPSGLRLQVALRETELGADGPSRGRVLLYVRQASKPWARGDVVRGLVRLRRPRNFGNPGEFDYERHLARRGIGVVGFVFDDAQLERTAGEGVRVFERWRAGVSALFAARAPATEAAMLEALVLGITGGIPQEVRDSFARSGVSHVLAISGLHVGLVAAVAYALFRWLLARSRRLLLRFVVAKIAALLSLVPVLLYAGIAGSNVATGRAVAMAILVLGAVVGERQANLAIALALAAIGAVAMRPGVTGEVSFQLSFVAVAGLLVAMERIWRAWSEREEELLLRLRPGRLRLWRAVIGYAAVSMVALLSTAPLVAYHFQRVSLAAPLANLVVTPLLATLVVPLGLLAALLQPVSETVAGIPVVVASPLVTFAIECAHGIAQLPGASLRVLPPSVAWISLWYGGLLAAVFLIGRMRRIVPSAAFAVLVFAAMLRGAGQGSDRPLRVTFLSVGQGDSAVLELPGGEVIVVDGGGASSRTFDVGERLVAPFLWSRGIDTVDALVVTHPQWDHFGGLIFLAEEFAPGEVWTSGATGESRGWARFEEATRDVSRVVVGRGFERRYGDVRVVALGPSDPGRLAVNDASIVLAVEYGTRRVLLAGDIETDGEAELVGAYAEGLRSDVVKVPHHGSRTSSGERWLRAVRPAWALVSAGRDNRFGFPHRDVVNRYRAVGATMLRTDRRGAVVVEIDGDGQLGIAATAGRNSVIDSL